MSKKIRLFSILGLTVAAFGAFAFGASRSFAAVKADSESVEVSEEEESVEETETEAPDEFECKVILQATKHGEVEFDKTEGHVGDIVTVTAKHDLFYLVDSVTVNGTALVEDEEISGLYRFALIEGDNVVVVKFVIDQELLGEMSVIIEQASNKDWTNLFSVENVVRIVSFLLSGGVLLAMVRCFIKDKKLAKQVEANVKESVEKIIPESTKETVLATVEEIITPIFSQILSHQEELERAMTVFAKCMALGQEDTPEARRAILDELSGLKIGDFNTIEEAKKYIEQSIAAYREEMNKILEQVKAIQESNKEIVNKYNVQAEVKAENVEVSTAETGENSDNGTQI